MLLTEDKEVDIFVGSTIGSFKHIKFHIDPSKNSKKCIENLVDVKTLQKEDGITCMTWGNAEETEILLARQNQQIQIYNTKEGFKKSYTTEFGSGHVVGVGRCGRRVLAAHSSGVVRLWNKKEDILLQTGGKLDVMRVCTEDPTVFATGGEENDLKLWKIGEQTPTFSAKNLANDWLQLRRPVWVTSLAFVAHSAGQQAAVCSRHGYVRLYDSRAQRRPVCNIDMDKMAATCISPGLDEHTMLVGFGRGQLHAVDLRMRRLAHGYRGAAGAVRDVAAAAGRVYSVALDRHVRVHHADTKQLLYKQYMTSKLSCVLVQTQSSTPLRRRDDDELKEEPHASGDEMDDLFNDMEDVGAKPEKPKKKKHAPEEPTPKAKKSKRTLDPEPEEQPAHLEEPDEDPEKAIVQLLRSTEKQKRRQEKKKKEKKAKSVYHNA